MDAGPAQDRCVRYASGGARRVTECRGGDMGVPSRGVFPGMTRFKRQAGLCSGSLGHPDVLWHGHQPLPASVRSWEASAHSAILSPAPPGRNSPETAQGAFRRGPLSPGLSLVPGAPGPSSPPLSSNPWWQPAGACCAVWHWHVSRPLPLPRLASLRWRSHPSRHTWWHASVTTRGFQTFLQIYIHVSL